MTPPLSLQSALDDISSGLGRPPDTNAEIDMDKSTPYNIYQYINIREYCKEKYHLDFSKWFTPGLWLRLLLCFLVEMNKNEYLNCFMEHGVNGVWKSEFAESLLKAMLCCAVMFLLYTSPHVGRWKL